MVDGGAPLRHQRTNTSDRPRWRRPASGRKPRPGAELEVYDLSARGCPCTILITRDAPGSWPRKLQMTGAPRNQAPAWATGRFLAGTLKGPASGGSGIRPFACAPALLHGRPDTEGATWRKRWLGAARRVRVGRGECQAPARSRSRQRNAGAVAGARVAPPGGADLSLPMPAHEKAPHPRGFFMTLSTCLSAHSSCPGCRWHSALSAHSPWALPGSAGRSGVPGWRCRCPRRAARRAGAGG